MQKRIIVGFCTKLTSFYQRFYSMRSIFYGGRFCGEFLIEGRRIQTCINRCFIANTVRKLIDTGFSTVWEAFFIVVGFCPGLLIEGRRVMMMMMMTMMMCMPVITRTWYNNHTPYITNRRTCTPYSTWTRTPISFQLFCVFSMNDPVPGYFKPKKPIFQFLQSFPTLGKFRIFTKIYVFREKNTFQKVQKRANLERCQTLSGAKWW